MSTTVLVSAFICSLLITYIITPTLVRIAFLKGIIDHPSERKVHTQPVPHLGGIGLFCGFAVTSLLFLGQYGETYPILFGAFLLVVVGVLDDIYHVPAVLKLLAQVCIASATVFAGISIEFISHPFGGVLYLGWASFPLTVFWIVSLINVLNLLDGSDGLAAGVSGITAITLFISGLQHGQAFAAISALAILGCCLGFLRYNFFPAKIFMGDAGSMFLGYILATTSVVGVLKSSISLPLAVPVLVLAVPIIDTIHTIYRRIRNKKAVFGADKEHLHHRLLHLGFSPKHVALFIYFVSAALGTLGIFLSISSGWQMIALLAACFLILLLCGIALMSERSQQFFHKKLSPKAK